MTDRAIANRHIRDLANRAEVAVVGSCLIFWREQYAEAHPRGPPPGVLHNVAVDQNALRVFQFEKVLYQKRPAIRSAHEPGLPLQPGQRLEHVIPGNLNIRRRGSSAASTQ